MSAYKVLPNTFETSTTQGSGDKVLLGAQPGARSFGASLAHGQLVAATFRSAVEDGQFEEGIYAYHSGFNMLTALLITSSSNGGAAVNWGPGTRNVWSAPLYPRVAMLGTAGELQDGAGNAIAAGAVGAVASSGGSATNLTLLGTVALPGGGSISSTGALSVTQIQVLNGLSPQPNTFHVLASANGGDAHALEVKQGRYNRNVLNLVATGMDGAYVGKYLSCIGDSGEVWAIDQTGRATAGTLWMVNGTSPASSPAHALGVANGSDSNLLELVQGRYNKSGLVINHIGGGAIATQVDLRHGGTVVGTITSTSTATAYNTASDARRKADVRPLADLVDTGAVLDQVTPSAWRWPDGSAGIGFVAQALAAAVPEAVSPGDSGATITTPWLVDQTRLIPYLVAEVQDLRRRLATLETVN